MHVRDSVACAYAAIEDNHRLPWLVAGERGAITSGDGQGNYQRAPDGSPDVVPPKVARYECLHCSQGETKAGDDSHGEMMGW